MGGMGQGFAQGQAISGMMGGGSKSQPAAPQVMNPDLMKMLLGLSQQFMAPIQAPQPDPSGEGEMGRLKRRMLFLQELGRM